MTEDAIKTPLEMFYRWEREAPNQVWLRQPKALQWTDYTWAQVSDQVRRIATYLRDQNYPAGSSIGIWSANSKDWPIVDLAIMLAGHVSVPLYPGQDVETARYIIDHSGMKLVFLGAFDIAASADEVITPAVRRVAMLGCAASVETSLDDIVRTCAPYSASPTPDPEAIFTMLYTSGTTGNAKGVMHAHATPGHVVPDLVELFRLGGGGKNMFSFLPMSHAAERIAVEMVALYANATISFSEGLATFGEELRSVQPDFFFAVPRLWIKFKEGIDAKIPPAAQAGLTEEQKAQLRFMLGLSKAAFVLTGSAPCPRDVQQWFIDLGIWLRDGYGMTENFIHGSAWGSPEKPIPGCVGQPMNKSIELKIGNENEIMFKSKGLMKGYYREPEKTAEALVDGWYRTGDTGRIDENGNLWVTGRLSEVFKTSKGKFIKPTALEDRFGASALLSQFCVLGHGFDQPVLLVTLSESGKKLERMEASDRLASLLAEVNAQLPAFERVGHIFVANSEWQIGAGLLTPTMKLKRKSIEGHYRPWIEKNLGGAAVVFE